MHVSRFIVLRCLQLKLHIVSDGCTLLSINRGHQRPLHPGGGSYTRTNILQCQSLWPGCCAYADAGACVSSYDVRNVDFGFLILVHVRNTCTSAPHTLTPHIVFLISIIRGDSRSLGAPKEPHHNQSPFFHTKSKNMFLGKSFRIILIIMREDHHVFAKKPSSLSCFSDPLSLDLQGTGHQRPHLFSLWSKRCRAAKASCLHGD